MNGMMQRLVTAIFFVAIMLGGIYGGPYAFVLLFGIITVLCLWEFYGLVFTEEAHPLHFYRKVLGVLLGVYPYLIVAAEKLELTGGIIETHHIALPYLALLFSYFIFELFVRSKRPFSYVAYVFLGIFYLSIPFFLLLLIAFMDGQYVPGVILGMLLLTWSNDTGAYLVGSQIGKTPLFPRISPKKTWEGSLGGVLVTILCAYLLSFFFDQLTLTEWLVVGGLIGIFGSIGDLVESMLKRSLQIKDSGKILPGHGGVLDRFDAFIFLIPFVAVYLLW